MFPTGARASRCDVVASEECGNNQLFRQECCIGLLYYTESEQTHLIALLSR